MGVKLNDLQTVRYVCLALVIARTAKSLSRSSLHVVFSTVYSMDLLDHRILESVN